jgi:hypothetical protein
VVRRAGSVRASSAEQLREQVMIAVPLAVVVQWHEEQVLSFEHLDDRRSARDAGDGVARGAQNRASSEVRARNCWISGGWRLSTSSARKSTMNRLLPVNWRMKACGDGWSRSEMAAR